MGWTPLRKPVQGFEGFYEVSEDGKVYSLARWTGYYTKYEKMLKPEITEAGYERVILCKNGKQVRKMVHQIVAENFIPNPENKPHINHIDSDRKNNCVGNLEWCTPKENAVHSITKGYSKLYAKMIPWEKRLQVYEDYFRTGNEKEVGDAHGIGRESVRIIFNEMNILINILEKGGIITSGGRYYLHKEAC